MKQIQLLKCKDCSVYKLFDPHRMPLLKRFRGGLLGAGTFFAASVLNLLGQTGQSSQESSFGSVIGAQELVEVERPPSGKLLSDLEPLFPTINANTSSRVYRSSNVERVGSLPDSAMVLEASVGLNAVWPGTSIFGFPVNPSLLLLGQRAYHGQFHLSDKDKREDDLRSLDYEFRMAMLIMQIGLAETWTANLSYEFDNLLDFYEGDTLYNAKAPNFSLRRIWQLSEKTLVMVEPRLRHSSTETRKKHPVAGAFFDDDGDNLQFSNTLTLIRPFGPEDRGLVMPSMGFMRTQYLRGDATGRVDYLLTAAFNTSYQWKPWLSSQVFANFGHKFANEKGEEILGTGSEYDVWDLGMSLSGSWSF